MHHYPFHPGDYILDTAHLEPMEDLAYRRLLDMYYTSEAPIPLETDPVSRRLRLGSDVVSKVLNEFFVRTDEGWKHRRCDAEIANYKDKVSRAQENGKLGGRPKKTDQVNSRNRKKSGSKANQELEPRTRTKNQESAKADSSASDEAWLLSLEADKTYEGIDIRVQLGKAKRWTEQNRRQCTRKFFVNWLNRAEKPLALNGKSTRPADQSDVKAESMRLL